ncbi:MAG: IS66 family insertion sequence element accessory protein TnpB [Pseudomonadales bacterium]|nr:IS66 family insertion sequence element accessory protein TnpB [Pseudomonadales bacterium]
MIGPKSNVRVWVACGMVDMRKGIHSLAGTVQEKLQANPFNGHIFIFRGRQGSLCKALWWDGNGFCLLTKRLERGRFVWPQTEDGKLSLTWSQLSLLLDGFDWRQPVETWKPTRAA